MSDYESLQSSYNNLNSEYNSYKSSHSHTNDEYNSYGSSQYAAGEEALKNSIKFQELAGEDHTSGNYSYDFTAPSDGFYMLQSIFSAYAGSGYVTIKSGTEIFRQSWTSKYGGHGVVQIVAKMSAGNTASLYVGRQEPNGGNSKVGYYI